MDAFRDRVAVVTGGGSGIGRGIALALAAEGMHVAIADLDRESAESVAEELRRLDVKALSVPTDVARQSAMEALADVVEIELGPVELLVNNAGVIRTGKLDGFDDADWRWILSVNLFGIVNGCRTFVPRMKSRGRGHILNTTSLTGVVPLDMFDVGVYAASKYAATGFSEILRTELEPFGIGVSILSPNMVKTNLGATSARNRPAEFGGPLPPPPPPPPQTASEAPAGPEFVRMEPEAVGAIVVDGLRQNRKFIFTHPEETRPLIEERFRELLADVDRAESAKATRSDR
jgi:NAD(P)-dependent dehydrogenase (short-subunit alcohol dehydrogenase family)